LSDFISESVLLRERRLVSILRATKFNAGSVMFVTAQRYRPTANSRSLAAVFLFH
jgi:hypothetical protein